MAALFFLRRYLRQTETQDLVLAGHTLLFGTASLLFGFSHLWAADWWLWHGFRLIAYSVLLVFAYDLVATLYLDIARHAQALEARTAELRRIEWLLAPSIKPANLPETSAYEPPYGDLTELNTARLILDSVGKPMLTDIEKEYLDLLGTSAAVYERNGDYALGLFSSGWCRFLDQASRQLCGVADNRDALACGKWHCHESCWTHASKESIKTGQPVDIECAGGLHLYAIPIRTGTEIIGSLNIGYGDPPSDPAKLKELAEKYGVSYEELSRQAKAYESRPPFIIHLAKARLQASARLIAEIVERKRAEQELRLANVRFRRFVEANIVGILIATPAGEVLDANDYYLNLIGYTRQELEQGQVNWRTLTPPEWLPTDEQALRELHDRGSCAPYEKEYLRRDGRRVSVFLVDTMLPGPGEQITAFCLDISERKRTETALRQRAEEVERLLEVVPAAIFVASDPTCRSVTGNRLANQLFEAMPDENVSATSVPEARRYYGPDGREIAADELPMQIAAATNQEVRDAEMVVRGASGQVLTLLGNAVPLRNERGEVRGCIGAFVDITERKRAEEALQQSEQKFRTMAEVLPQIIWITTPGGWNIYFNQQWVDYTGLTLEESYGHGWITPFHPDDQKRAWDAWQHATQTDGIYSLECRLRRADGIYRWWLIRGESLHDANGEVVNWFGTCTDIQNIKESEEKLRLAASVFTHTREGIMITDADGSIIDVNDAFSDITGYSRDEVLAQTPRLLKSGLHENEFYAAMWRDLIEQGQWHGELWNQHKNGEIYAVMQTISAVRDEQGNTQQYVALYTDITHLKEHQQKLERSAHYDALTSLPNRVLLADRLHQGMVQTQRRGQRLAVAFLDLDGFKAINDAQGHEAGDQLLITVADRMKQALREGDTLARMGGDEFVAVLLDLNGTESTAPFSHLLAAAAEPVQFGEITLQVSASVGVTLYPQAEDIDADQLLRQADQAMYQAKLAGKNRYHFFDAEMDRSIRGRYESLERIRNALAAGEFVLYYQPKVNMREGRVIGAEALIRWQHPEKGLLLPDLFLPEIEDHSLAIAIGEWVIDTALSQMEIWQAAGLNIPVSVNIGSRQLQQTDFVERLRALLEVHPTVSPSDLQLEVLETYAMKDLTKVSSVIEACREIGVSFALDDFGTGYSSLTYLKHLPVAQLKIDKSFVHDMVDNPDDLSIVEGVIGLASAFRLLVIAEGAESLEHSTILLQLGCDLAQGYGIARPMPASQLPGWEATWQPDSTWINLSSVSRVDLPLLFANVEHRSWIIAMEKYLTGEREVRPTLDIHQCRFGQWLNTEEGIARFGAQPSFEAVDLLHRQVHDLAAELCTIQAQGRQQEALERLGELHGLGDALLEQLRLSQQNQK